MLRRFSINFLIRAISLAFVVISSICVAVAAGGFPSPDSIATCLLAATAAVSFPPCGGESLKQALWAESLFLAAMLPFMLCVPDTMVRIALIALCALVYALLLSCRGLRSGRRLFVSRTAWKDLTNYSRLVWVSVFMVMTLVLILALYSPLLTWAVNVLLLAFYVFMMRKASSGRTFLMPVSAEAAVRNPYPSQPESQDIGGKVAQEIYSKVVERMEKDMAYLDPKCSVTQMARELGTNRTYLSRVVNDCSGMSFPKFVGQYRVEHAATLLRSADGHILIRDLAERVGYNCPETLNNAFKSVYGMSPGEYQQNESVNRLARRLSRRRV